MIPQDPQKAKEDGGRKSESFSLGPRAKAQRAYQGLDDEADALRAALPAIEIITGNPVTPRRLDVTP